MICARQLAQRTHTYRIRRCIMQAANSAFDLEKFKDIIYIVFLTLSILNLVFLSAIPAIYMWLKKSILKDADKRSSSFAADTCQKLRTNMDAAVESQKQQYASHERRLTILETEFEIKMQHITENTSQIMTKISELTTTMNTQFNNINRLILDSIKK